MRTLSRREHQNIVQIMLHHGKDQWLHLNHISRCTTRGKYSDLVAEHKKSGIWKSTQNLVVEATASQHGQPDQPSPNSTSPTSPLTESW
ncbi:hypothetical protein O3P69_016666 [Scylla paramamosain]|uniref:Uncharacterized protein n=1 Tax=Scylla paramamosain TaxID=85552 RepID=A0AAW0T1U9_SCYPA